MIRLIQAKQARLDQKLVMIYAMNIADWICTVVLLRTDLFIEANPLMRPMIDSIPAGFLVKCLLPALLILSVSAAVRRLEAKALIIADRFISFLLVFYLAVDLDHVLNFLILFFQKYT